MIARVINNVRISGCNNPIVANNHVINTNLNTIVGHLGGGICMSLQIYNTTISNNYIENAYHGIGNANNVYNRDINIVGNTFVNIVNSALDGLNSSTDGARGVSFTGNKIYSSGVFTVSCTNLAGGVVLPSQFKITDNYFYNTKAVFNRINNLDIAGNSFEWTTDATSQVLTVTDCTNGRISGNRIVGGAYGIVVNETSGNVLIISDNLLSGQVTMGIYPNTVNSIINVAGNTITNDSTASASYYGILLKEKSVARNNYISLNKGHSCILANDRSIVRGNICRKGTATYSIYTYGGSTGVIVENNDATSAPVNNGGVNNTFSDNNTIL